MSFFSYGFSDSTNTAKHYYEEMLLAECPLAPTLLALRPELLFRGRRIKPHVVQ